MQKMSRRSVLYAAIVALVIPLAAGCGGSVTKNNYDKVKDGMTLAEVEAILGKGKEQSSVSVPGAAAGGISVPGMSAKGMVWQDGSKIITITFINDKVMGKAQAGL